MKVVLCANTSWYLYNFRKNLIAHLKDKGCEVFVIAPFDDYTKRLEALDVQYSQLCLHQTGKNVLLELQSFLQLLFLLKKIQPDVVLTFTIKCNLYVGLLNTMMTFKQIANISGLGEVFEVQNGVNRFIRYVYRHALRNSHRIFFQNKEDLQIFNAPQTLFNTLSEHLPGSGVDLSTFKPVAASKTSHSKRIFLMFGRMLPNKGYDLFLQAAAHIKQSQNHHAEFWVLGIKDCSRKDSITLFHKILEYHDKNIITYIPARDDVVPIIQQADVVVLPSQYHEGVPRCLLEAMACGKPIITTDWKGCRDAVDDHINGLLIKKGDLESLQHALEFFISADDTILQKMGKASRQKAENEFDEQEIIRRYLQLINEPAL